MRIISAKDAAVTVGVLDKDVAHRPDLVEVTYVDDAGQPHTVYGNKEGPFTTPEEIAQAHIDGVLHTEPSSQPEPETPTPPAGPVVRGEGVGY
jgi:hypothetical protein